MQRCYCMRVRGIARLAHRCPPKCQPLIHAHTRKLAMGATYSALLLLLLAVSLHVDGLEVEPLEGDARLGVWWDPVQ